MFRHITAVVLFVKDFEKCLAFYRDTVGLPVAQLEPKFVAFKMHDQDFALLDMSEAAEMFSGKLGAVGDRAMLCTRVEDVDAAYATLKGRGVEFAKPPVDQTWGIRAIYFRDPEDNLWEFAQPIHSA